MKVILKVAAALMVMSSLTACGIDGETGDISFDPGCLILCFGGES